MPLHERTNSGVESKGSAFGLEGNLFFYLVGGLLADMIIFGVSAESGVSAGSTIIYMLLPWPFIMAYLITFCIGKPPSYQGDFIQNIRGDKYISHTSKDNPYE